MKHDESTTIVNLSDASVKRRLMVQISKLTGLHEVKIKPRKRTRTLDQNSYYFVAVVQPFRDWLRDEYGDLQISSEQAHEMLKVKMLGMDEKLIEESILIQRGNALLEYLEEEKLRRVREPESFSDAI